MDDKQIEGRAAERLGWYFGKKAKAERKAKKEAKKKTRQKQIEDQLRKSGLTQKEIDRLKGKQK